ncbi:MAG TPA: hypothetical protein VGW38_13895, partial [Chloroflexota bacterium]|nr:hypothetical protein [Chloroflexota bacterium]
MTRRLARVSPFFALALAASLGVARAALPTPQDAYALSRLAAPSGYADIVIVSQSGTLPTVGGTLVVDVRVQPNNVQVDAAAAYLTYDADYLELVDLAAGSTDDTLIHRDIQTPGTVYYA